MANLEGKVDELKREVRKLEEEKQDLEEELAEERKPDYVKPNRKKEEPEPSGRKGGHKGESRKKPDHVDFVEPLDPLHTCPDCDREVSESQEWKVRYKEEIVLPRYRVTRIEIPRSFCSHCDKLVEPEAEGILPKRQLGNKLRCYVVYLREELRLPVNMVQKHMENLGMKISEGLVENVCSEAAEILEPHYEQMKEELREAKATNNDETGKRIEGENRWEWVFTKLDTVVFHSDERRSHKVMEEQYGKRPKPVLGSDCYNAYNPLDAVKQRCWSHLLDDSSDLEEEEGESLHESLKGLYSEGKLRDRGPPLTRELSARYCEGRLRDLIDRDWSDPEAERVVRW